MSKQQYMEELARQERVQAAAPVLLRALKDLVELCDMGAEWECRDIEPYKFEAIVDDTLRQAAKAIKLAEGL